MRHPTAATLLALGLLAAAPALAQTAAPSHPGVPSPAPSATAAPKPGAAAAPSPGTAHGAPLDINSASKEDLDALPGIGAVRAEAIVKGRPYKSKDELLRKKIIPENVYNGIKDKIVARHKS